MQTDNLYILGTRYYNYYGGRIDRDLCMKLKKLPKFQIGKDACAWTGADKNGQEVIHVGIGLLDTFPDGTAVCTDENEFHSGMRFLTGHEAGHQKYTTQRSWEYALNQGYYGFVEYVSQRLEGKTIRIVKESDCDSALKYFSDKYKFHLNPQAVKKIVHFVVNSLEDGRMERCNMREKPGFRDDLRLFRGKTWLHSGIEEKPDLSDPGKKLTCILNQLLTQATMGVWQKGFVDFLIGTEVDTFITSLKPAIEETVMARSCAKGMRHAVAVLNSIYPFLFDACSQKTFETAADELIKGNAIALPDMDPSGENPHSFALSEKEDKERESSGQTGDIPKESSNIFENTERRGNTKGKDSDSGKNKNGNVLGKDTNTGEEKFQDDSDSIRKPETDDTNIIGNTDRLTKNQGMQSGSKGQDVQWDAEDYTEMITEAMRAAAAAAAMVTESTMATETAVENAQNAVKVVEDKTLASDVIPETTLKSICTNFNEYLRQYELNAELPSLLKQECAIVRRQYEQYFRSRMKPVRRNQKAGFFDPRQLSRFVRGDLDVYRKMAKDGSFSGCIEILLDNSGSMSGEKKQKACETLARIEECLKGLVPIKIIAFDSTGRTNVEIIKNWAEVQKKNCSWNFFVSGRNGGGTPTKEVLSISGLEMGARQEKHKLIILLTDENGGNSNALLKPVISDIRKKGIQICGIYFENRVTDYDRFSFGNLFDNIDAIVCEPKEIGNHLLPIIKRFTQQR